MRKKEFNPAVNFLTEKLRELEKTEELERKLRKYGRKVHGGYMMTVGDLLRALKND